MTVRNITLKDETARALRRILEEVELTGLGYRLFGDDHHLVFEEVYAAIDDAGPTPQSSRFEFEGNARLDPADWETEDQIDLQTDRGETLDLAGEIADALNLPALTGEYARIRIAAERLDTR